LKIRCFQNCEDKVKTLETVAEEFDISLDEVAFVGNDINDEPCLNHVGLPIVVNDAHQDVVSIARYQTRNSGGCGAVREICDLFEQVLAK
jgi:YrbI family 3-deoxy-D-manno-octulosonate 8-phosphate phosphatase